MMRWAICLMMLAVMAIVNGCGGGGRPPSEEQPPPPSVDRTPPEISNLQVNPTKLRFVGGEVTISAVVRDSSGVERAWAVVQKPDGTKIEVLLSSTARGESYEGKFQVESNTRNDGQPLIYRVWLRARDRNGNETPQPGVPVEGLTVEVAAPLKPPQEPSL